MSMERLALNVTLDGTDAVRGIGTVRKAATDGLGEVEKSSTRAATGFTNAGARIVASGAAIAGGLGIAAVGAKVLFDAYSDRTEAVNKTGVVFGDAADRRLRHVAHEQLHRLVQVAVDHLGQRLRVGHGELEPFAAHHLDDERQLELAAAEIGRAHV